MGEKWKGEGERRGKEGGEEGAERRRHLCDDALNGNELLDFDHPLHGHLHHAVNLRECRRFSPRSTHSLHKDEGAAGICIPPTFCVLYPSS